MLAAPVRLAVATASALIDPAPTTSTSRPASAVAAAAARRQAGRGELDRDAEQAPAGPVDAGLRPGPLAGPQRQPAEVAEHPAQRAVLLGAA